MIKSRLTKENSSRIPLFYALNKVDMVEPFREWNVDECKPGNNQEQNIKSKTIKVAGIFGVSSNMIIPVSASEGYNLSELTSAILYAMPSKRSK